MWITPEDAPRYKELTRVLEGVLHKDRAAHHLFAFSILYLFILFAVLLIDARVVG